MATPSCSFTNLLTGNKLGCKIFRGLTGHAFEGRNSLAIVQLVHNRQPRQVLGRLNREKPEECEVDQVEAALATSLNTTAIPESVREQLLQLAVFLAKNTSAVVKQLTLDSPSAVQYQSSAFLGQ